MRTLACFINCLISCCLFFRGVLLSLFGYFPKKKSSSSSSSLVCCCCLLLLGLFFFSSCCPNNNKRDKDRASMSLAMLRRGISKCMPWCLGFYRRRRRLSSFLACCRAFDFMDWPMFFPSMTSMRTFDPMSARWGRTCLRVKFRPFFANRLKACIFLPLPCLYRCIGRLPLPCR